MEIDSIDNEVRRQPQKRKKSDDIYSPIANNEDKDSRSEMITTPDGEPAAYFAPRSTIANRTCWYMGFALVAIAVVGFAAPNIWEFHFGFAHNVMNLLAGIATFGVGITRKGPTAKIFATALGSAYLLLGIAGFIFGMNVIANGALEA
ncbi:MAG: hypothetical protein EOP06_18570, partial [Proteobacteria bacterium]